MNNSVVFELRFFVIKHISNHIIIEVIYSDCIDQYFHKYLKYHSSIQ